MTLSAWRPGSSSGLPAGMIIADLQSGCWLRQRLPMRPLAQVPMRASSIFTPAACEGTTTLFPVEYFDDQKAYLTQSGQLYLESTAMALGRVYSFGPTFRAEKSKTRRHLTEFWMIEPEMPFYDQDDNMRLQEDMLLFIVGRVLERCRPELKELERDVTKLEAIAGPFPRIDYTDAVATLQRKGSSVQWGDDLGAEDEALHQDANNADAEPREDRREPEVQPHTRQQRVAEIRPKHEEGAVREVGDAHQAEDERETGRKKEQQAAEGHAVQGLDDPELPLHLLTPPSCRRSSNSATPVQDGRGSLTEAYGSRFFDGGKSRPYTGLFRNSSLL